MYRENYINSLHGELLAIVAEHLTPTALKYGYSDVPLEANIKWRPLVLLIGNYSSGKSTLINDFLGAEIQKTGQAPTDDSFTIIAFDDQAPSGDPIRMTEERDGKVLLNDPEYPFENLKKHGQRFAAHFRLKKVNAPFLRNLAIIDTPGMLDSIAQRDRGYNYHEVVGDLAQIADLILVLFDPHKAGTVREAHESLRDVLPARTFEDRILFVLNRIDECGSLPDLLRVYGTLCWNMSQITGRKDIPRIHLTYSPTAATRAGHQAQGSARFLDDLENQRDEIKAAIMEAPRYRLDHLAAFIETHSTRLLYFLYTLIQYGTGRRRFWIKTLITGAAASILGGGLLVLVLFFLGLLPPSDPTLLLGAAGASGLLFFIFHATFIQSYLVKRFHKQSMTRLEDLVENTTQAARDSWDAVKDLVEKYLNRTSGRFSVPGVKQDHTDMHRISIEGAREIRQALHELSTIRDDLPPEARINALAQNADEEENSR